ncbi:site-specific integrase [Desulfopila sp. IMCC35008]|uniref:tyrosine-type recombinase/integrase n=1 Tax=Desulfopila sp. IMCC35008 TaxID=2653858 RepID=UPI0013CF9289|nr:site-specific integrase [Desulfopila sp. IMCC35008]
MATYRTIKRKKGTVHQAIIRRKGLKPLTKTFDTKGQAKHWAAEQEGLIYMKKYKDPRLAQMVTLEEALKKYASYTPVTKKKAASTLDREIYSRRHLERIIGKDTPLSDIESSTVAAYQSDRLDEGGSASSIRQEVAMLSKMFRVAKTDWGLPVDNPTAGIERVSPAAGRERFMTEREAVLILEESKKSINDRFYPYLVVLMHTGMRSGEAARLTADKVDLKNQTIRIEITKTGKPRTVALTDRAKEALESIDPLEDGYYFLKPNHRQAKSIMLRPGCIFRECWKQLWRRLDSQADDLNNPLGKIPYVEPPQKNTVHITRQRARQ